MTLNDNQSLYASFGVANKEPNRSDYTESTPEFSPNTRNTLSTQRLATNKLEIK